jgi:hypothetical protein
MSPVPRLLEDAALLAVELGIGEERGDVAGLRPADGNGTDRGEQQDDAGGGTTGAGSAGGKYGHR